MMWCMQSFIRKSFELFIVSCSWTNNKNQQQWKAAEKFPLESLFIFIAQTTTITIKFSNENNLIIPGMQMNKKRRSFSTQRWRHLNERIILKKLCFSILMHKNFLIQLFEPLFYITSWQLLDESELHVEINLKTLPSHINYRMHNLNTRVCFQEDKNIYFSNYFRTTKKNFGIEASSWLCWLCSRSSELIRRLERKSQE